MTTALEGVRGQSHAPAALYPPGKTRYQLYRRLGVPQGRSGQVRKISLPPGFDPRTVQPVASRYNDWATRPTTSILDKIYFLQCPVTEWSLHFSQLFLRDKNPIADTWRRFKRANYSLCFSGYGLDRITKDNSENSFWQTFSKLNLVSCLCKQFALLLSVEH